jgi:hypothetical protein
LRIGEVFRRKPEIHGVLRELVEQHGQQQRRFEGLLTSVHRPPLGLAGHLDVAHRSRDGYQI